MTRYMYSMKLQDTRVYWPMSLFDYLKKKCSVFELICYIGSLLYSGSVQFYSISLWSLFHFLIINIWLVYFTVIDILYILPCVGFVRVYPQLVLQLLLNYSFCFLFHSLSTDQTETKSLIKFDDNCVHHTHYFEFQQ